jgi:hypothetical protein
MVIRQESEPAVELEPSLSLPSLVRKPGDWVTVAVCADEGGTKSMARLQDSTRQALTHQLELNMKATGV